MVGSGVGKGRPCSRACGTMPGAAGIQTMSVEAPRAGLARALLPVLRQAPLGAFQKRKAGSRVRALKGLRGLRARSRSNTTTRVGFDFDPEPWLQRRFRSARPAGFVRSRRCGGARGRDLTRLGPSRTAVCRGGELGGYHYGCIALCAASHLFCRLRPRGGRPCLSLRGTERKAKAYVREAF